MNVTFCCLEHIGNSAATRLSNVDAAWTVPGAMLGPGGSRKQYRICFCFRNHNQVLNEIHKGIWKNTIWGQMFDTRMGGLECREPNWRSILVTLYEVSSFREKALNMGSKRAPHGIEIHP